MEEDSVSVVFRIDRSLKQAFERVAKDKDQTVSQLLRAFIRYQVENHAAKTAQKDLFKPSEPLKPQEQANPSPTSNKHRRNKKRGF